MKLLVMSYPSVVDTTQADIDDRAVYSSAGIDGVIVRSVNSAIEESFA